MKSFSLGSLAFAAILSLSASMAGAVTLTNVS